MPSRFMTALRAAPRAAFLVSAFAFLPPVATPALAQAGCAEREEVVRALESQYGERLLASGLAGERVAVEVFVRPDGASWTIVLTRPDGTSCAILAGKVWHPAPQAPGDTM